MSSRGKKRLVVEVDLDLDPAAEVTAAFDRLCVSVVNKPPPAAAVGKDSASSTLVNSVAFGKDSSSSARSPPTMSTEQPHSWSTPAVTTPLSAASTVPYARYKEVYNGLNDAIEEMQKVAMNLKALSTEYIVPEPSSGKEILVNQLMWRVHELAQSLDEALYRSLLAQAGPSPPLSEYFDNDRSDDEAHMMSGGDWALEDVNFEEIRDRMRN